jgi:hypothetical protein
LHDNDDDEDDDDDDDDDYDYSHDNDGDDTSGCVTSSASISAFLIFDNRTQFFREGPSTLVFP